jgi:hypothetical protein
LKSVAERALNPAAAVFRPLMAFGMPETMLSSQASLSKCRNGRQLDILVFGMPKTDGKFFC